MLASNFGKTRKNRKAQRYERYDSLSILAGNNEAIILISISNRLTINLQALSGHQAIIVSVNPGAPCPLTLSIRQFPRLTAVRTDCDGKCSSPLAHCCLIRTQARMLANHRILSSRLGPELVQNCRDLRSRQR